MYIRLWVCVCVIVCAWITENEWGLESGVSTCDVGFWCFPNQRDGTRSDGDVMSSSGFSFSHKLRPHASRSSFITFFLSMFRVLVDLHRVCLCTISVSLCTCLSLSFRLYLLIPLSFHCRRVGVHCLFFYEWDVLFTLWQSYLCQRWWWTNTVWPHLLPPLLPFSLWLAKPLLSMAKAVRLWSIAVNVCVWFFACAHID